MTENEVYSKIMRKKDDNKVVIYISALIQKLISLK